MKKRPGLAQTIIITCLLPNGYKKRLTCKRSLAQIPAMDTEWTYCHINFLEKLHCFVEKTKINGKEAWDVPLK